MTNEYKHDEGIDVDNFDINAEIAKFDSMKPQGWSIIVRLYTSTKKTLGGIIIPDTAHDEQQYRSCTGLVVKKSKGAYLDDRYVNTGAWCEEGDWVIFPRHAGYKIFYEGVPIWVLKEDAIDVVIDDPRRITR